MEELQEAISDVRYLGERARGSINPLVAVDWPYDEVLRNWKQKAPKSCFEYENVVAEPAGMYLFCKFASRSENFVPERLKFLEEVQDFKQTGHLHVRVDKALQIYEAYLSSSSARKLDLPREQSFISIEQRSSGRLSPTYSMKSKFSSTPNLGRYHSNSTNSHTNMAISSSMKTYAGGSPTATIKEEFGEKLEFQNVVGAEEVLCSKIKQFIDEEREKVDDAEDDYDEHVAGKHFIGYFPTLFDELVDIFTRQMKKVEAGFMQDALFEKYMAIKWVEQHPVSCETFCSYRIIGRGGFGEVFVKKRVDTGMMYAVKALDKGLIKQKRAEDLCWNEMKALCIAESPFIVTLKYAFQNTDHLFLVLDLMSGGDLCYHLNKSVNGRFPADQARFHAIEILLGIRHLHEQGYIYRDLKPDNVLLTDSGHCKISDLGLAVIKSRQLVGTAGTLGYMPPEMFRRNELGHYDPHGKKVPYNETADWWSYGCVVFEMLVGKCPFRTTTAKQYYENLFKKPCPGGNSLSYRYATCSMDVEYGSSVFQSNDGKLAKDLIQGCLNRNPHERLGSDEVLFHRLKYHPWFTSHVDVNLVAKGLIEPPFTPKRDEVNADSIREITRDNHRRETLKVTPEDQIRWKDWYYVSKNAFQQEVVQLMEHEEEFGPFEFENKNLKICSIM